MTGTRICRILEIARWSSVSAGFYFAFAAGADPVAQFHVLTLWVAVALCGLTGFESVFLGEAASGITGYEGGRGYQRQSGLNNLAVAIAAILSYSLHWGVYADAAITTVVLVFFVLSALNHLWSAVHEGNHGLRNLMRPVLTAILVAAVLPMMLRALCACGACP